MHTTFKLLNTTELVCTTFLGITPCTLSKLDWFSKSFKHDVYGIKESRKAAFMAQSVVEVKTEVLSTIIYEPKPES